MAAVEPGQEAALIQALVDLTVAEAAVGDETSALARLPACFVQPGAPVILLGPAAMTNQDVLQSGCVDPDPECAM
jgi:hypothetical protein